MLSQVKGLEQSVRNAGDVISIALLLKDNNKSVDKKYLIIIVK